MNYYKAPWGVTLIVVSSLSTILFFVLLFSLVRAGGVIVWVVGLPVIFLIIPAYYAIFGYTVTSDAILIHRPFWQTRLGLFGLESVEVKPGAMRWSIRTMGNGGLFSITGYFKNKSLGEYRAFVTDRKRTVVLRYGRNYAIPEPTFFGAGNKPRTIVLSPVDPEVFARDVQQALTSLPPPAPPPRLDFSRRRGRMEFWNASYRL